MGIYRITKARVNANGLEFEAADGATEQEVAQAAFEAVSERLDYGWEPVDPPAETDDR